MQAVGLLAEDRLTDEQIAAQCGVSRRALAKWKKQEPFLAEIERIRGKAADGAAKATEKKAFVTTDRLIELANLAPKDTNGTIGGQVKACLGVAQIRGEIVQKHEDLTPTTASERKLRTLAMLREGAQRVEKVQ